MKRLDVVSAEITQAYGVECSGIFWNAISDNDFTKNISLKDIFKHPFVGLNLFFFKAVHFISLYNRKPLLKYYPRDR